MNLGFTRDTIVGVLLISVIEFLFFLIAPAKDAFWALNIAFFILILSFPIGNYIILKYFSKAPESVGSAKLWKKLQEEIFKEELAFGYPENFKPRTTAIFPSLGYYLVDLKKEDCIGLSASELQRLWEGTVVFDYANNVIFQQLENMRLRDAIRFLKDNAEWTEKERRKVITLPTEIETRKVSYV